MNVLNPHTIMLNKQMWYTFSESDILCICEFCLQDSDDEDATSNEDRDGCPLPRINRIARVERIMRKVEDVTQADLEMVANHVKEKKYDSIYVSYTYVILIY